MNTPNDVASALINRRNFLSTSSKVVAGTALVSAVARPGYTAENNTIKVALVGCGGRGGGAVRQALSTSGPTKLWAVADFFDHKAQNLARDIIKRMPDKVELTNERIFAGLDGYKNAIDSLDKGSVVLLATAPAFRPIHVEYAIAKGMHVFMEKSWAGLTSVL